MELATGGGSSASAFGGMGRGEAVEREKGGSGDGADCVEERGNGWCLGR